MSRNTAAVESASQFPVLRYRVLVDVMSCSAPIHVCTGGNFIYTGANTYSPIGGLGSMDPVQEDSDVFARAVRLQLAAVFTSQIADLTSENLFNKPVNIWRCFLNEGLTIVDTPSLLFKGRINTANLYLDDPQKGNYYEIEVESRLKRNPRALYFDRQTLWNAMQQSGDTFFDQLTNIPNYIGEWGKSATNYHNPDYSGGGGGTGPGTGRNPAHPS